MRKNKLYIDFHIIQTVPPSCINRDDTGSPKTAVYGGVTRARVSSQCWKREIREQFKQNLDEQSLGIRTKKIVELVALEIITIDSSIEKEDAKILAEKIINLCGVKTKDEEAGALFFMSRKQAQNLAKLVLEYEKVVKEEDEKENKKVESERKKAAKAALNKGHGIDVALFGRMVADDATLNADASAQVAHAISTHRVDNEYDYFTAIDDMTQSTGAGMIGTVEFNSATLYRYATVAVHGLFQELAEDVEVTTEALTEFAKAFIISMPDGKKNSFANYTVPDVVWVSVREDRPINMVGAFERPLQNRGKGFVEESIKKLSKHMYSVYENFASKPVKSWKIGREIDENGEIIDEYSETIKLNELDGLLREQLIKYNNTELTK